MNVRWKPLLILSGLFATTALAGVAVWVLGFGPGASEKPEVILAQARSEREAGEFDRALIQYRRALQAAGGADASIQEEIAAMSLEAMKNASPEKKSELRINRFRALAEAARIDRRRVEPRRTLMRESLAEGEELDSLRWAEELITLDSKDPDANYLLAEKFLDRNAQDLNKARKYIELLAKDQPNSWRVALLQARLNRESNKTELNQPLFKRAIENPPETTSNTATDDQIAWARLRIMAAESIAPAGLKPKDVNALELSLETLLLKPETSISHRIEWTKALQKLAQSIAASPDAKPVIDKVNTLVENSLKKAIDTNKTDMRLQLALAQHLLASNSYKACLELVESALKSPEAKQPNAQRIVFGLRDLAVKSLLADQENPNRFNLAEPHIKSLLTAKPADIQGLGHLFQGAIDLERSGIGQDAASSPAPNPAPETAVADTNSSNKKADTNTDTPKTPAEFRRSAMDHLGKAAAALPEVSTAHALYGVALILNREPELGRQSLQKAWKLGIPEIRYQVWTAWSQVMAGYPEDALPIVNNLLNKATQDPNAKVFLPTLYLLLGEIHQARNTPASLQLAYESYGKALNLGKETSTAVHLRVAQLEMLLKQSDRAQARLAVLTKNKDTAAAALQLQILALIDKGDLAAARNLLNEARKKHPDSVELIMNEAMLLVREGKAEQAEKSLGEFSASHPDVIEAVQLRAQILAEKLGKLDQARKMINDHLAKHSNSSLQAQAAQLAIAARDFAAANQAISTLRKQWPEAASADLLSAQLSLAQNNLPGALASFQAALKKDPNNKIAQFWSAQMEARLGAITSASETLQKLVNEAPVKQIDSGVSLTAASQSALANLEIDAGNADAAINRLQSVIRESTSPEIKRDAQWKMVAALASKRDWATMDQLVQNLTADKSTTPDELVKAANYERSAGKTPQAFEMLDRVLKTQPTHPGAAALKGFMLADSKKYDEAAQVVSTAWQNDKTQVSLALLLAALENGRDPQESRSQRALAVLNDALVKHPNSTDVIKAIFTVRRGSEPKEAMLTWLDSVITDKSSPATQRLKAQLLASESEFDKADAIFSEQILQNPQDLSLVMDRLQTMRVHIGKLDDNKDREQIRTLNAQLDQLIGTYRGKFQANPEIFAFEAEVAADRGQADRAIEISRKIDALNPTSPLGPLVRVRVLLPRRQWDEVVSNLEAALARDPRRRDLRLQLATIYAEQNRSKDAIAQIGQILSVDPENVDATLLKARLLVTASDPQTQAKQALEAIKTLEPLLKSNAQSEEIYEEAAALARLAKRPELAAQWLNRGLQAMPDNPSLASLLIENAVDQPGFDTVISTWTQKADADKSGRLALAISVALQRSGQLKEALDMSSRAIAKSDSPGTWLNQGGILLALAEASPAAQGKVLFEESIQAYDKVLEKAPDAIEAVNNKAWILHHHLGRHQSAADVVDSYLKRTDPSRVPAEFDDTVGAIREAVAQTREAEKAYASGLAKAPSHPMLNFHLGRLLSRDPARRSGAAPYLQKAIQSPDRLSETELAEARKLLAEVQGKTASQAPIRAN